MKARLFVLVVAVGVAACATASPSTTSAPRERCERDGGAWRAALGMCERLGGGGGGGAM